MNEYKFNISLSVLNHLGRNLYRNIITILGEAISNSWDADANNVRIFIDREKSTMLIIDDGLGMSSEDFQNKFLKIGYSKRRDGEYKSKLKRPFIGRKGIGKLALLSCAEKITVVSKTANTEIIGGTIDNSDLDRAITEDLNSQEYNLMPMSQEKACLLDGHKQGTAIYFEKLTNGVFNTIEYIKRAIALYFKFSLVDPNFNIYVNEEKITEAHLKEFAESTQFLWTINGFEDPIYGLMNNLDEERRDKATTLSIKGYIATVKKPSDLKLRGTQEKATIDLFVNGRLREKDLLRHIPTARIVENYAYGQIHYDDLDNGEVKDIFTSSREGIVSNEPLFNNFLNVLNEIFRQIMDEWDDLRRKAFDSGDPDNHKIEPKQRKAQELFNETIKEMNTEEAFIKKGGLVEDWVVGLEKEASFNVPSYTECFISENLLRRYVRYSKMTMSEESLREAEKWKGREEKNKEAANISYDVRVSDDNLYYLDMGNLANLVDKAETNKDAGLSRSATVYKPLRDAVGHTSILTQEAKSQLTLEYKNIKARLVKLLKVLS